MGSKGCGHTVTNRAVSLPFTEAALPFIEAANAQSYKNNVETTVILRFLSGNL